MAIFFIIRNSIKQIKDILKHLELPTHIHQTVLAELSQNPGKHRGHEVHQHMVKLKKLSYT